MELIKAIVEANEPKFVLQQRWKGGAWEELDDGLHTRDDAQEFLDNSPGEEDVDVEERAISTDGKEILKPKKKASAPSGKDTLARDASPEVHKRNADFFDKNL